MEQPDSKSSWSQSELASFGPSPAPASSGARLYVWVPVAAILGFLGGIGATVAGLVVIGFLVQGPKLAVDVVTPAAVRVGEPFQVDITVSNPHDDPMQFSDLDFPDRFFDDFSIESLVPPASADSPLGGFGSQTYYYEVDIDPDAQQLIRLTLKAKASGRKAVQFDVCNADQNCSTIVRGIQIQPAP